MPKKMKFNFSGYATKFNVKCTDGRTIKDEAFKHQDGLIVPLVYAHGHKDPENVIGHALLEYRENDGMYAYSSFNNNDKGKTAKELVEHGDIKSLSIYANQLKQKVNDVVHGCIREVSLVLAGANPEAYIDYVELAHGDGYILSETDAIMYVAEGDAVLKHDGGIIELKHAENGSGDKTIKEVFSSFSEEQLNAVYAVIGSIEDEELEQNDGAGDELEHNDEGDNKQMKKNVFDQNNEDTKGAPLKHSDFEAIFTAAKESGSLKKATIDYIQHNDELKADFLAHAGTYGIDNVDYLFPDARKVMTTPELDKRRTEWVSVVLNGINKVPFSRIKTQYTDITTDDVRAKGYVKTGEKVEGVIKILKRTVEPTTVYIKQKMDRDDILDITDFDVVMWLKSMMRLLLDEEIARAYLVGDGRAIDHKDKIDEDKIIPIWTDEDIYAHKVALTSGVTGLDELEAIKRARKQYKGSGKPMFFTTIDKTTDWTLLKDANEHYRFRSIEEVATFIGVSKIVEVEVMEGLHRDIGGTEHDLIGIMVSLRDYTSGADKGGKLGMFNQFDIDFNQEKYLIETRNSAALTKIRSAVVVEKAQVV